MIGKRFRSLPFISANDNYTLRTSGWYLFDTKGYLLTRYQVAPDKKDIFFAPKGFTRAML